MEFAPGSALRSIGAGAFQNSGLTEFAAPPSLQRIGSMAFSGCENLGKVSLNLGLRHTGWLCFSGTHAKVDVLLPQISRETLGIGQDTTKLLVLPEGVEVIEKALFEGCRTQHLVVPASVREIEGGAFDGNQVLKRVSFHGKSALEKIGPFAFRGCTIDEFCAPVALRQICTGAFSGCKCLRMVKLNKGLEMLGEDGNACGVFEGSGLVEV